MREGKNPRQPERTFYYYRCKGKYEDNGSGGKHCICYGHIFTLETGMAYCPTCDQPLQMIESKQEKPEAITCALKKCISCKDRHRSVAINDEHCLGGTRQKDGKIQNVLGSQLCNGCPCVTCCKEIIEDANALKKYGMGAVVKAQAKLKEFARHVQRLGNVNKETEKMYIAERSQDPVLSGIRQETCERWAMDALQAVKKEMAEEAKDKGMGEQYERKRNT
jgi:uncharacterized protein YbaR (Trm112 family)